MLPSPRDNYCPSGLFIVRDFHAAIDIQIARGLYPSNERDRDSRRGNNRGASDRGRKRQSRGRQRTEENFITSTTKELHVAAFTIRVVGTAASETFSFTDFGVCLTCDGAYYLNYFSSHF